MSDQSAASAVKSGESDKSGENGGRSALMKMAATGLAILVFAVVGGILVYQFTEAEREREMRRVAA